MATKFRIDTIFPDGHVWHGEHTGDGLELSKDGSCWLLQGDEHVLGFTLDFGEKEKLGRRTVIRLVG